MRKIFEVLFVIFAKHSIKMLVNFSSPYNRSFVLGRFSADVSNVVNETNFDLWKKKLWHHFSKRKLIIIILGFVPLLGMGGLSGGVKNFGATAMARRVDPR